MVRIVVARREGVVPDIGVNHRAGGRDAATGKPRLAHADARTESNHTTRKVSAATAATGLPPWLTAETAWSPEAAPRRRIAFRR